MQLIFTMLGPIDGGIIMFTIDDTIVGAAVDDLGSADGLIKRRPRS
jgi:hypothetical protein